MATKEVTKAVESESECSSLLDCAASRVAALAENVVWLQNKLAPILVVRPEVDDEGSCAGKPLVEPNRSPVGDYLCKIGDNIATIRDGLYHTARSLDIPSGGTTIPAAVTETEGEAGILGMLSMCQLQASSLGDLVSYLEAMLAEFTEDKPEAPKEECKSVESGASSSFGKWLGGFIDNLDVTLYLVRRLLNSLVL